MILSPGQRCWCSLLYILACDWISLLILIYKVDDAWYWLSICRGARGAEGGWGHASGCTPDTCYIATVLVNTHNNDESLLLLCCCRLGKPRTCQCFQLPLLVGSCLRDRFVVRMGEHQAGTSPGCLIGRISIILGLTWHCIWGLGHQTITWHSRQTAYKSLGC